MRINHNIAALNTYRQLSINNTATGKALEKLSSGLRINRAGDDAAGLAISEKMRGQIRGLEMASKNAQDGISLIQTAEGALNEVHSILQRMRELAVQATNDTNNDKDRAELQKEVSQLIDEIDRIANTTEFNTKKLLNGELGAARVATAAVTEGQSSLVSKSANVANVTGVLANNKVGTHIITFITGVAGELNSSQSNLTGTERLVDLGITDIAGLKIGKDGSETTITGLTTTSTVADLINAINTQATGANGATAALVNGKLQIVGNDTTGNALSVEQTASGAGTLVSVLFGAAGTDAKSSNHSGTQLTIRDEFIDGAGNKTVTFDRTGFDGTAASDTYNGLTITKGTSDIVGGDTFTVNGLAAKDALASRTDKSATFQIGANENQSMKVDIEDMSAKALGLVVGGNKISIATARDAAKAITTINTALETVSAERAKLGAFQNRLEHTINNLGTSAENLTAAESRIRDVDMAKEMMEFTKNNILNQAAQAMLAQANQQPQGVLQLLR